MAKNRISRNPKIKSEYYNTEVFKVNNDIIGKHDDLNDALEASKV